MTTFVSLSLQFIIKRAIPESHLNDTDEHFNRLIGAPDNLKLFVTIK